jgi:hypothetical protein
MDMPGQTGQPRISQARVVFGLVVMLVGTVLLLDRLEWWGVRLPDWGTVPLWPWILVVLGLVRLSDSSTDARGCQRGRRSGMWLLFVGGWGLLNEYRLFGIHYGHSWPILLIGAGVLIVWRSMDQGGPGRSTCAPVRHEP